MKKISRIIRHLVWPAFRLRTIFNSEFSSAIQKLVHQTEGGHCGQFRIVIEGGLDLREVVSGYTPRQRALSLFATEKVWDTEYNSGLLIYALFADRAIEIVADRGIVKFISEEKLHEYSKILSDAFRRGEYLQGYKEVLDDLAQKLRTALPCESQIENELSDAPKIFR